MPVSPFSRIIGTNALTLHSCAPAPTPINRQRAIHLIGFDRQAVLLEDVLDAVDPRVACEVVVCSRVDQKSFPVIALKACPGMPIFGIVWVIAVLVVELHHPGTPWVVHLPGVDELVDGVHLLGAVLLGTCASTSILRMCMWRRCLGELRR